MTAITLDRFLVALYDEAPRGSLIELRYRHGEGMRQSFIPCTRLHVVAAAITKRSAYTDVHIGVIPRRRRGGGRADLVAQARVVWADCDTPESVATLRSFSPRPSVTVRSGSGKNLHCYWLLSGSHELAHIERANRQLAHAIGADLQCTDAARVLRPPQSRNWKHDPAAPVRIADWLADTRYDLPDLVADLADPQNTERTRATERSHDHGAADSLLDVLPAVYIERITGVVVPAHGKIVCPFHDDHTPSLHVYCDAQRGWYCFGCGAGGSVYDFAARTWSLSTRGVDFIELRSRLRDLLGFPPPA